MAEFVSQDVDVLGFDLRDDPLDPVRVRIGHGATHDRLDLGALVGRRKPALGETQTMGLRESLCSPLNVELRTRRPGARLRPKTCSNRVAAASSACAAKRASSRESA
ncbi:hypothetical protein [Luteimonas saliphila]|uniref:hypothetical protein n=1 Tax=Luteimonas saliphila TaxID=2804919 RepID=UPI00192DB872|nr:hypothetical protein [Luteimonas saliphila]